MKRIGNLYTKICSLENLQLADIRASKSKKKQHGVIRHIKKRDQNILRLQGVLINKNYQTSSYTTFTVNEGKERLVYKLPYFPDRITHHAVMNILEPIFVSMFTADTYSCIKGRGIHSALDKLKKALFNERGTRYCLKLDVTKFYPSIDHDVLKALLRRKFKDNDLLWLLDEIIDSATGLPIGNYLSQYLANFYLTYFDHWLKEQVGVKNYFRYADDMIILTANKAELHKILHQIRTYLADNLKLTIKGNYQIFPVDDRGIDFIGYVTRHTHVRIRPRIKRNFARKIKSGNVATIASYKGWTKHADCKQLVKKLLNENV